MKFWTMLSGVAYSKKLLRVNIHVEPRSAVRVSSYKSLKFFWDGKY